MERSVTDDNYPIVKRLGRRMPLFVFMSILISSAIIVSGFLFSTEKKRRDNYVYGNMVKKHVQTLSSSVCARVASSIYISEFREVDKVVKDTFSYSNHVMDVYIVDKRNGHIVYDFGEKHEGEIFGDKHKKNELLYLREEIPQSGGIGFIVPYDDSYYDIIIGYRYADPILDEQRRTVMEFIRSFATDIYGMADSDRIDSLRVAINNLAINHDKIVYVQWFDNDGLILVNTIIDNHDKLVRKREGIRAGDAKTRRMLSVGTRNPYKIELAEDRFGRTVYDISVPILRNGSKIGIIRIGYSLSEFAELQKRSVITQVIASVVFVAAGIIVGLLSSYWLTRPLAALEAAARKAGRGDLDTTVIVSSGGREISRVANEFNKLILARKNAETELTRYKNNLEIIVETRTQELSHANDKLLETHAKLEKANRIKSEFLANMSHEIRTPLNAIIALSELLLRTKLENGQYEYVSTVYKSGRNLLDIINDILDISKIEAGKLDLVPVPLDLLKLVSEQISVFRVTAQRKGIAIDYSYNNDLPRFFQADELRVRQILVNLIGNAVKFTVEGHVHLVVDIDSQRLEGADVTITVEDTGPGISPQLLDIIFDKFTQADTSITRKFEGTGLGLAITRQLVEMMGGRVFVNSTPGIGSIFGITVTLPYAGESDRAILEKNSTCEARQEVHDDYNFHAKTLVVDDHEVNLLVASRLLESLGCSTDTADCGMQAIEKAVSNDYDIIFMDIQMPDIDGYETTGEIRKRLPRDKMPVVIALTAAAMKGDRDKCVEAGLDDYITKPVSRKSMIDILTKYASGIDMSSLSDTDVLADFSLPGMDDCVDGEAQVFNFCYAMELASDARSLRELLAIFISETEMRIVQIRDAYDDGDFRQVARIAHGVKGSAATVGAELMRDTAYCIEENAVSMSPGHLLVTIETLESEFGRFSAVTRDFVS